MVKKHLQLNKKTYLRLCFMQKKLAHIFLILITASLMTACNSDKKIHDSETTKTKKVKKPCLRKFAIEYAV